MLENLPMNRPKCWCLGLSRTGTTSFCEALKLLGYYKVVHNPRFEELKDLDGGADYEVVLFYKYLDYKFPGSKFVLMLRNLEDWLQSVEYIYNKYPVKTRANDVAIMRRMSVFESTVFDREKFISAYHRHHADVRRYFRGRPGDLLEMNLVDGDGWEILCPFLNLPIPSVPFPLLNRRESSGKSGET